MVIGSRLCGVAAAGALLAGAGYAVTAPLPSLAAGGGTHVCSGSPSAPGVLAGSYGTVAVSGICFVNSGPAVVHGDLTVRPGGALLAAFALNDRTRSGSSHLTVTGDINVEKGGTMILGCFATSFACLDDPDQSNPTLNSHSHVEGDIVATDPLGVILHNVRVDGSVSQVGGGGGHNCNPSGIFAVFGSPVYSDYEDSGIGGSLSISRLTSCWLGVARVNVYGSLSFSDDHLADPDAIEILSNFVAHNLSCTGNSMVWDSGDQTDNLYPRVLERNHVAGERSGQCVLSSPVKPGGTPGPWKF